MPGFLYVPIDASDEPECISRHYTLLIWYTPLNWLDHKIRGSPEPVICVMRLSG